MRTVVRLSALRQSSYSGFHVTSKVSHLIAVQQSLRRHREEGEPDFRVYRGYQFSKIFLTSEKNSIKAFTVCQLRFFYVDKDKLVVNNLFLKFKLHFFQKFCSNVCFKRSSFFKEQLLSSPLWLREKEDATRIQFHDEISADKEYEISLKFLFPSYKTTNEYMLRKSQSLKSVS